MRRTYLLIVLLLLQAGAHAQEFSNKGKDFWLCFPSHVPNEKDGITWYARMSLFITGDKNSSGKVSIPGIFSSAFTVTAGQVTEIDVPYNLAHINTSDAGKIIRKGIHVQVDTGKPSVVVYSHIYAGFRSAASLILPVAVLGKKYYSMNAPQVSINGSKSQFVIVAVDTNTTVLITPVRNGVKGTPFSIQLPLPGDLYEFQDNNDLSGSLIESVSPNTEACKKIAVFSGSSAIHITTTFGCTPGDSYDPLYQQLYPVNAWGKRYGFIPFGGYVNGNPYRILASEDNTQVTMNGMQVATLNAGEYYPSNASFGNVEANAVFITADKPVSVAQYAQSSSCSGANVPAGTGYGDPDMVLLNPVEQNVNDITVFSSQKENIYSNAKFINVLIKQNAAASFTINGVAPAANWLPVLPAGSGFVYAKIQLSGNLNAFTLKADSAFNAIAYGFGDFESYAYSAGTNVKDLYRSLTIENEFGNAIVPVGCNNSLFHISVTYPYQPQKISFIFYGLFPDETITNPVPAETYMVDGVQVYRYRLNNSFTVSKAGFYPVTVIASNNNSTGCNNGNDEMDYEISIIERPKADFTTVHTGCITDAVQFTDATNAGINKLTAWFWDFGDNNNSSLQSPAYSYASANSYTVKLRTISDIGCGSDTAIKTIAITNVPVAGFQAPPSVCAASSLTFTDATTFAGNGSVVSWIWDYGDQQQDTISNANPLSHTYALAGKYTASLFVQTNSGCKSNVAQKTITVHPSPVAAFRVPVFCLPAGTGQFINESAISDGSALSSAWDFGDGNTGTATNPVHRYKSAGPFNVKLTVNSSHGCTDDSLVVVNTIFPQAKLQVTAMPENCFGDSSDIVVSTKTNEYAWLSNIYWSEGVSALFTDTALQQVAFECRLPVKFNTAGNQVVRIFGTTPSGCFTDTVLIPIYVNQLPVAGFQTSSPLCEQQSVSFTDASISGDGMIQKWQWDFGNGNQSNLQNPQQVFVTGTWPVTLQVKSTKGCTSSAVAHPLTIAPLPVPAFHAPAVCVADPFMQFTDKSTIADGNENSFTYKWYFDDKNASPSNPDFSNQKNAQHTYAVAGNYQVRLEVTSKEGCTADTIQTVQVNGAFVQAGFTSKAFPALCNNQPVLLQDASSVDAGTIIRTELFWNYDTDPLQKTANDDPQTGTVYSYQYPAVVADKNYHIKYVVYSGISCLHQLDTVITIKAAPAVEFNQLTGVCLNADPFVITGANETSGMSGTGHFDGPGISADGLFHAAKAQAGMHTITYNFVADNGCVASAQQILPVYALPTIFAGPDKVLPAGSTVRLGGSAMGNNIRLHWSPTAFMDNAGIPDPLVSPPDNITYKLTGINEHGCTASDETTVKVIQQIQVPNAFTPNNDGKNDVWKIPYLNLFDNCTVRIFSRWGEQVFSSNGYNHPWNGTKNGIELPAGTYPWIIDLKNGQPPLKGVVILVR